MIASEDIFKIGFLSKKRGLKGELEMIFTDDCFDTGSSDYLVLDMDGIPVPFFWEEYSFKRDDTVIIKFEGVDDQSKASNLVGRSVYYPKAALASADSTDGMLASYKSLTGYHVTDATGVTIGTVSAVDNSSANTLLAIERPDGTEVIVPYHDDFLVDFAPSDRRISLRFPPDILILNDEL